MAQVVTRFTTLAPAWSARCFGGAIRQGRQLGKGFGEREYRKPTFCGGMSLAEAGEGESLMARLAFEADLEGSQAPQENGGAATPQRQSECSEDQPDLDDEVGTYEVLFFTHPHI